MENTTTTTTCEQAQAQFKSELFAFFDIAVDKEGIREAFENWGTRVLHDFALKYIEGNEHLTESFLTEITREYRLKLEQEVRRQSLETIDQLTTKENINKVLDYYNQHIELAEYIIN